MSRYIDADALTIIIRELPNTPNGFSDVYDKAYIIGVIEEVPTADVKETVKGAWKLISAKDLTFYCSECGKITTTDSDNYCPRCGAEMKRTLRAIKIERE